MAIFIEILTFVIVLVILILVHEIGHFIVAKLSGMRVDEFGIGYPPRALTIAKIGETEYTLNWLPFGGFVRIFGEDAMMEDDGGEAVLASESVDGEPKATVAPAVAAAISPRAFSARPKYLQALTLVAGIAMNILFAYILFTVAQAVGVQQELSDEQIPQATNVHAVVAAVSPNSLAAKAGFEPGDEFVNAEMITPRVGISYNGLQPLAYATLISQDSAGYPIEFTMNRNGKTVMLTAIPQNEIVTGTTTAPRLGFVLSAIGTIKVPLKEAPIDGLIVTKNAIVETASGLYGFFKNIVLFKADLSQVSGPIGIAGAVGNASSQGFTTLLSLTALISINLALINLIPIPALDGGRLLFVIIEAVIRRPLNPKVAERVNLIGFGLLLLLMFVVSAHDIYKLFVP